jgi:hypothetical protein
MTLTLLGYGFIMLPLLVYGGTLLKHVCFIIGLFALCFVEYLTNRIKFSDDFHPG